MSDGAINPRGSLLGCLARYSGQVLFAYPFTLLSAIPLFLLFSKLGLDGTLGSGVTFAGFGAVMCLYIGALLGYMVGVWIPSLIPTGRWVWVPPTIFVLGDIVPNLLRPRSAPGFLEYIYASNNNEGLAVVFVTLPLTTLLGYSIGSLLAKKQCVRVRRGRALIIWAALLAVTSALMVPTERRMVATHSKLAVAVRIGGTPLMLAPNAFCGPLDGSDSQKRTMLPSPTKLRLLRHLECPSGKPPLGIDRVIVVDGPNRGLEGWVMTSQVWKPLPLR